MPVTWFTIQKYLYILWANKCHISILWRIYQELWKSLSLDFPGGSDSKEYLSTMQETWVWSLGQEDTLEKGVATHFSILACKIPWTKEPGGYSSGGITKNRTWLRMHARFINKYQLSFSQTLYLKMGFWFCHRKQYKGSCRRFQSVLK